jgi:hypothetical protein
MKQEDLIKEILATYQRHSWQLQRVLLRPSTRAVINEELWAGDSPVADAEIDALWFSRASQGNREAWELRLVAATQYALFETFEADEPEETREEVRLEMESRMREKVSGSEFQVPG